MRRWFRSPVVLALAFLGDVLLHAGPPGAFQAGASLEEALAAQAVVNGDWLDLDHVVGSAVGRDAQGRYTVRVYLSAPGASFLPETVEGVHLVPEVTGPFLGRGAGPPTAEPAPSRASGPGPDDDERDEPPDPRQGFPRPVPIGVSTGHPDVTAGTIGARVTDGIRVFALSNNHVFANNNEGRRGDNLLQPGVADGGRNPEDVVGTLYDFEPIRFCGLTCPPNRIDAALALTTPDDLSTATPDGGYGSPRSRTAEATLGLEVQKFGRTTGHTQGRVTGIHATIDVSYRGGTARFEEQIVVSGDGFSTGGDSGSMIVTRGVLLGDRRPVGLLFAGSRTSTIANPIGAVLDRFGVTVDGEEGP